MAWSDAARRAAIEARRRHRRVMTYEKQGVASGHIVRSEMAKRIRGARRLGLRGEGAMRHATNGGKLYTNVRYAKDASQGLSGSVSPGVGRRRQSFGYRRWSAKGYS